MPDNLRLARFRVDVTPPVGDPICGGWIAPSVAVAEPLSASGIVLLSDNAEPIVLCVVDWCEIANASHINWCKQLANAVGTTPDRVALHAMHPHCTPWPDQVAQAILDEHPGTTPMVNTLWCNHAMEWVNQAANAALAQVQPLTHIALGKAVVDRVASNRRIIGSDGKSRAIRSTRCTDATIRAEPEGLIDPYLKTISFWNGNVKIAVLSYYAVHATSNDSDRKISPDFPGLARDRRFAAQPHVVHAHFTGCAGDLGAGKYNDGSPENRPVLAERLHRAMVESERTAKRVATRKIDWQTTSINLPPRTDVDDETLRQIVESDDSSSRARIHSAMQLSYRSRMETPITLSRLSFGDDAHILHLPGESFIHYQLLAQSLRPDAWMAVAAYGDCGPGYICLERSYDEGGYEPVDSFVSPACEKIMHSAIHALLKPAVRQH